jgi:hypothetical protein
VQTGDTLSSGASAHGLSLATAEADNPQFVNFDLIYTGDIVHLSGGASTASAPSGDGDGAPPGGAYGHPYKCGDGDGWDMPCWKLHGGSSSGVKLV